MDHYPRFWLVPDLLSLSFQKVSHVLDICILLSHIESHAEDTYIRYIR